MSLAIFRVTAARWTKATPGICRAAEPRTPTWLLRWKLRRVRLQLWRLYHATNEHARIYRALAARETGRSDRERILAALAEAATRRAERLAVLLRKYRVVHSLPAETWLLRVIRWFLARWRISWTLALLDRSESRHSHAMLEALMRLSHFRRVIAAARVRSRRSPT